MKTSAEICLLACRFANALINANARRPSSGEFQTDQRCLSAYFHLLFNEKPFPLLGLLACRFANALINTNAKRVYSSRGASN